MRPNGESKTFIKKTQDFVCEIEKYWKPLTSGLVMSVRLFVRAIWTEEINLKSAKKL